jgi:hypothetical protein
MFETTNKLSFKMVPGLPAIEIRVELNNCNGRSVTQFRVTEDIIKILQESIPDFLQHIRANAK